MASPPRQFRNVTLVEEGAASPVPAPRSASALPAAHRVSPSNLSSRLARRRLGQPQPATERFTPEEALRVQKALERNLADVRKWTIEAEARADRLLTIKRRLGLPSLEEHLDQLKAILDSARSDTRTRDERHIERTRDQVREVAQLIERRRSTDPALVQHEAKLGKALKDLSAVMSRRRAFELIYEARYGQEPAIPEASFGVVRRAEKLLAAHGQYLQGDSAEQVTSVVKAPKAVDLVVDLDTPRIGLA